LLCLKLKVQLRKMHKQQMKKQQQQQQQQQQQEKCKIIYLKDDRGEPHTLRVLLSCCY